MFRLFAICLIGILALISLYQKDRSATPTQGEVAAIVTPTPSPVVLYVTGSSVNLRAGPATSHARIAAIPLGSPVRWSGETQGVWKHVSIGENTGWMHGDYLAKARTGADLSLRIDAAKATTPREVSFREIQRSIIEQSIASYPGSCPCPNSVDRGGRRFGGRSAYSRPGGYSPICHARDVTDAMVATWRARKAGATLVGLN